MPVMDSTPSAAGMLRQLARIQAECSPELLIAYYSAAVALEDRAAQTALIDLAANAGIDRTQLREAVLQSYLFLGYPRMITAAEILNDDGDVSPESQNVLPYSSAEGELWASRGEAVMRQVYGSVFGQLRDRALSRYPEIFRWMVVEGYGKVLARPGLSLKLREIATVSFLIVENRDATLYSHLRGGLNVGVAMTTLREVVAHLAPIAPDGAALATRHLNELERQR